MEKYLIIYPDGHTEWMSCEHDQLLKSCYKVIGCSFVENVRTYIPDVCLIVDESGKIKHPAQPFNALASTFYNGWIFGFDPICGPVVVAAIHLVDGEPDWVPLNDFELELVNRHIRFFISSSSQ